jgi:hypothetical protein
MVVIRMAMDMLMTRRNVMGIARRQRVEMSTLMLHWRHAMMGTRWMAMVAAPIACQTKRAEMDTLM